MLKVLKSKIMGIMDYHTYKACIDACLRCAVICNHCAKSCTLEPDVTMMARCIQLDMECAAICYASAELMSLHSTKAANLCRICAEICGACGTECDKHDNDHCRECAAACRYCEQECMKMAA